MATATGPDSGGGRLSGATLSGAATGPGSGAGGARGTLSATPAGPGGGGGAATGIIRNQASGAGSSGGSAAGALTGAGRGPGTGRGCVTGATLGAKATGPSSGGGRATGRVRRTASLTIIGSPRILVAGPPRILAIGPPRIRVTGREGAHAMSGPIWYKYPGDVKLALCEFGPLLAVGDTLTGVPTFAKIGAGTMTFSGQGVTSTQAYAFMTGGAAGDVYVVTCDATSVQGQTLRINFNLTVHALSDV